MNSANTESKHLLKTYVLSYSLLNLNLFAGHPAERFKVALQINTNSPVVTVVRGILQKGIRDIYAGLPSSIIRQNTKPLYRVYLTTAFPNKVERVLNGYNLNPLSIASISALGSCALDLTITTPLELLKTQVMNSPEKNTIQLTKLVYTSKGFKGFYVGWVAGFCKSYPSWINLFYTYHIATKFNKNNDMTLLKTIIAAGLSSIPITILTTPSDVIKTVMQAQAIDASTPKVGFIATANKIIRSGGVLKLWRGIGFRMLHRSQGTALAFIVKRFYDSHFK